MSRRRQVRAYLAESRPEAERWSAAVQCLLRDVTVTADTGELFFFILDVSLSGLVVAVGLFLFLWDHDGDCRDPLFASDVCSLEIVVQGFENYHLHFVPPTWFSSYVMKCNFKPSNIHSIWRLLI